jgi:hypothetical protein
MMAGSSPCYASARAMVASMARPPLVSRAIFPVRDPMTKLLD